MQQREAALGASNSESRGRRRAKAGIACAPHFALVQPIPHWRDVETALRKEGTDTEIRIINQQEIIELLEKHPDVARKYLSPAVKRSRKETLRLGISFILTVATFAVSSAAFLYPSKTRAPLGERIETVEGAIGSLKDLEQKLQAIKDDMENTQRAKQSLEAEYAKAKELEKLSDQQFEAVKAALQNQNWKATIIGYTFSFFFGVASSFFASYLYAKWVQWRALNRGDDDGNYELIEKQKAPS